MNNFGNILKVEFFKIVSNKAWWIVFGLVVFLQPLFAMISAKEIVTMGLEASPATNPYLAQALPPLEYLGFYDVVPFGLLPMVVLGGIIGASEYKNHHFRTTLLCCSNRKKVFFAKVVSISITSTLISAIAIYLTIVVTHISLGDLGLNPLTLSLITWKFIIYAILEWTLLTVLAFAIGVLSRNVIIPLVFLIPQIYGLAPYLASKWSWGEFLPVTAGKFLTATPTDTLANDPVKGGIILGFWTISLLIGAMYSLVHRDLGGGY